jgi:hypothetical protein
VEEHDVAASQEEDWIMNQQEEEALAVAQEAEARRKGEEDQQVINSCLANNSTLLGLPAKQPTPTKDKRINRA